MKIPQQASTETLHLFQGTQGEKSSPDNLNADHLAQASADLDSVELNFSCSDDWCQITTNEFDLVHFLSPDAA